MSLASSADPIKKNIFLVNHSDLEDRLDPLFYVAVKNIRENVAQKAKYECVSLKQCCTIRRGRFGHRPRNDPKFYNGDYPFIQTGDVVKASNSSAQIEYTQTLNERGLKTSRLFQPRKLLFTIAANIGDTAILDFACCFPDSVVALIPKSNEVSIDYLNIYLRIIKPYVVDLAPYSAQRNLNNQQLAQVPVVIPPEKVQAKIVERMDAAYVARMQKEQEANKLLDSFEVILKEVASITLPELEEKKAFYSRLSDLDGPLNPERYALAYKLDSSYGKIADIGEIVLETFTPASISHEREEFRYLRIDDLPANPVDPVYRDVYGGDISGSVQKCEPNDVLISRLVPTIENSKFVLAPDSARQVVGSNEFICLRCNNEASPIFVLGLLRTEFFKRLMVAKSRGATPSRRRLSRTDFSRLPFPLLEKKNQAAVVNEYSKSIGSAKKLLQDAIIELDDAKREVEGLILDG